MIIYNWTGHREKIGIHRFACFAVAKSCVESYSNFDALSRKMNRPPSPINNPPPTINPNVSIVPTTESIPTGRWYRYSDTGTVLF
jgi:hypothetical protein